MKSHNIMTESAPKPLSITNCCNPQLVGEEFFAHFHDEKGSRTGLVNVCTKLLKVIDTNSFKNYVYWNINFLLEAYFLGKLKR